MDLVIAVDRLAREGETLSGGDLALFPGGKGANQACAAARLGGQVFMIGQVGADPFGPKLLTSLREAGVDVSRVGESDRPTGCAAIYVLPNGENSIVISPGANAAVNPDVALSRLDDLEAGDLLLSQLEIPLETVEAAFEHATSRGTITILDPAPARQLPEKLLSKTGVLTPNQTEATCVLRDPDHDIPDFTEASVVAGRLIRLGPRAVVMKLGSLGSVFSDGANQEQAAALPVSAVDTTAAGDVFNGAFAVALSEGAALPAALRFANAAAAISVTRNGAQASVPGRAEVEELLARGS
jgi:ribokinase